MRNAVEHCGARVGSSLSVNKIPEMGAYGKVTGNMA